jgi:hypothetical protein
LRRTLVLLSAALLATPALGAAQAPSLGVRAGLNMASFAGRRIVEADYRAGLSLGASLTIPVAGSFAIQPEVLFSRKGAKRSAYDYDDMPQDGFSAPPVGVYLSEKTSHDYLEIPVLLKLSPAQPGDVVRPIFFAGPTAGFLLGVKETFGSDYKEHLKSADFGLVFGGGVEMGKLSLDGRYNLGLSSVAKDFDSDIGVIAGDIENRGFTLLVGVRLF